MKAYKFFSRTLIMLMMALTFMAGSPCAHAAKPRKAAQTQQKSSRRSAGKSSGKKNSKAARKVTTPQSSAEAKRLEEAARREIQQTKEKIRLNDEEIKVGLADLNALSSEIKTGRERVSSLQKKVSSLQGEISSLSGSISKNEKELQRMRDEYLKAVKKMRLNSKNQSMLAFIFASDDFNQALRRLRYMRQFSKWKERKSEEIHSMIKQLADERELLAKARETHAASLGQLSKSQAELETKHSHQKRLVDGLKQNGAALQKHLSQKQNEANQLKNAIATLIAREQAKAEAERKAREKAEAERLAKQKAEEERIAREKEEADRIARLKAEEESKKAEKSKEEKKKEEDRKKEEKKKEKERRKEEKRNKDRTARNKKKNSPDAKIETPKVETSGSKGVSKSETKDVVSDFASMRGRLPLPVDGGWRITNPFGRHSMPELPDVVYDNPGIDAEVAKGTQVKAVAAGKVSGVYKLPGYGNVVIVNHGDYYTVYGNLASVNVSVGSRLSAGNHIGAAAADPDDAKRGSVHFELWHGREKQDPESWLR